MSLFNVFFLSMIFGTGLIALIVLGKKFFNDMKVECRKNKAKQLSFNNTFKLRPNKGPMAVRNH